VLEVYVGYLRKKLEAGGGSRLIHTVRGWDMSCGRMHVHPLETDADLHRHPGADAVGLWQRLYTIQAQYTLSWLKRDLMRSGRAWRSRLCARI